MSREHIQISAPVADTEQVVTLLAKQLAGQDVRSHMLAFEYLKDPEAGVSVQIVIVDDTVRVEISARALP